jgi:PAS domain S-box-containing protein
MPYIILVLSIVLQLLAAILALRLTTFTDKIKIWLPIAIAICLMALRRCFDFYDLLTGAGTFDLRAEVTALTTAALMVIGVTMLTPVLRSKQRDLEYLQIQHDSILNSAGEGIFGVDREGRTIFANPAARQLTGYREGELLGERLHDLIHHTNPDGTPCSLDDCPGFLALRNGNSHQGEETIFWTKEGQGLPVEYFSAPIIQDSQTVGAVVVFRDITHRKRAEEQRSLLAAVVESSDDAIIGMTPDALITSWNSGAAKTFGFAADEAKGQSASLLVPPERKDEAREMLEKIKRGESLVRIETELRRKDEELIPVSLTISPIRNGAGEVIGAATTARNIAGRRQSEERLRESEQNLRQLAVQLIAAQEQERERLSRELHDELGQSLLVLKLQTRQIERHLDRNPAEAALECREMATNLDDLVDNVRRLSRDLSPAILEDLGLSSALRHLIEEFAKRHDLQANFELPPGLEELFLREEQVNIYRIFQETLTNIGKYAQASNLRVVVSQTDDQVSFLVADNGRGFDVEEVLTRGSAGRGLGLAAMQERVRMLGGTLKISSQPGQGTEIAFSVPIRKA